MSHPATRRLRRLAGFTLIELLTVIAIIGILAAILIPTVGKVRSTANNTRCIAQLREWGRVIQLYANDNKGNYYVRSWASVAASDAPGGVTYSRYFTHSIRERYRMRLCPSDPNTLDNLNTATAASLTPTYGIVRGSIGGVISTLAPESAVPLGRARNPSQYILMMDSIQTNEPISGENLADLNSFVVPLTNGTAAHVNRHGGKNINAVFGDGSIKRITWLPAFPGDATSLQAMRPTWFQIN